MSANLYRMGKVWSHKEESKKKISASAQERYKNNSVITRCQNCDKEYKVPLSRWKDGRGKFCSRECKTVKFKGRRVAPQTEFKKGQKPWNKGVQGANSHMFGKRRFDTPRGPNHPSWKGQGIGYAHLHKWLRDRYGKPCYCDNCGENDPSKRYEWANISGEYRRDIKDFARLCKSCHVKYDHQLIELDCV